MALKIKASGVPSGSPLARLRLLSSCEERKWPTGQTEKDGYCGMSAHTVRNPAERDIECAATSFFPRRKKDAKTPPGFPRTPDGQPVFLKENRRCRFFLNRCSYNKGAKGPRGPVGRGTEKMRQPIPGAAALFIWAGAGAGVRVDFHREKIDKTTRGSKGGPPWHVFAFFLRVKKEGGPQAKPE